MRRAFPRMCAELLGYKTVWQAASPASGRAFRKGGEVPWRQRLRSSALVVLATAVINLPSATDGRDECENEDEDR